MTLPVITFVVFLGFLTVSGAILLLIRDVFSTASSSQSSNLQMKRQMTVMDELPSSSPTVQIDHALERLVLESGVGWSSTVAFLMVLTSAAALGGIGFVLTDEMLPTIAAAVVGMVLPIAYLSVKRSKRMREIQDQLPEVLDLMARALHAGETLDQAVSLVGNEVDGALGSEFAWCARQMSLGMSTSATMQSLARRVRLMDMRILATTLSIHRKSGGNLASTLENLANVVRDRMNSRRQMRATTGAGRASATLIASVGPLLFLFLFFFQRDYIQGLFNDSLGQTLLTAAFLLELVGVIWVWRLLRSDH